MNTNTSCNLQKHTSINRDDNNNKTPKALITNNNTLPYTQENSTPRPNLVEALWGEQIHPSKDEKREIKSNDNNKTHLTFYAK